MVPTTALGRGMASIRILLGLTFLLNGLAKFFDITRVSLLGFRATLIGREDAAGIMQRNGLESRGGRGTAVPLIQDITRFLLEHYDTVRWLLAGTETIAGALLVLGAASRLGALLALLSALYVQALYYSSGAWLFEEPLIWVPLFVLALVPAGRSWGVDRAAAGRRLDRGRRPWPY
ncbi:DoxX family membrane protein [Modestobacter sp. DSM 44400]|uniref:DoxX family membrane protein n=1 Tax=Modestobacter sp. DSM 44400 TaxID=1550230 RepID=UPI0015872862|nr:DoxX family membrane protein [Modestobacter sp. DSM 44400]